MRRALAVSGLLIVILAVAAGRSSPAGEWTVTIERVASPAAPYTAQPQLTASEHGVVLSWLETVGKDSVLKFAERTPTGWSTARTVASGDFFANWADVPSVMRLADRTLAAHWLQVSGTDTYAYDLRLAWSRDDGRTWSPSFTPHHDGTKNEHGFASLYQMPGAGLGVVWLDGRAMKPPKNPDDDAVGDMSLRSAVFDKGWKQLSEDAIDLRVCECCPTAAAATSEGVIVAYRDRGANELRNINVARLVGGKWSPPSPVHDDGWRINGCPVNGPGLSAVGREVAIAWFTAPNNSGHAFVAFSQDAGRTFSAPIRVDDQGSLGRVDVEQLPDGSALVSWIELASQRADFKIRRVERSGHRSAAVTVATITASRNSGYPRIARNGNELLLVWNENTDGSPRVQTAAAKLP